VRLQRLGLSAMLLMSGLGLLFGLSGCAHRPVVANCPEWPEPPALDPIQRQNYLCRLAQILEQPQLCQATKASSFSSSSSSAKPTTTPP